jgi:hypothetical protein
LDPVQDHLSQPGSFFWKKLTKAMTHKSNKQELLTASEGCQRLIVGPEHHFHALIADPKLHRSIRAVALLEPLMPNPD